MPSVACPFCNAALDELPVPDEAVRTPCPRCGETLPLEIARQLAARTGVGLPGPEETKPKRGRTLIAILALMVLMAVVGLSYALWTTSFRRANDFRTKRGTILKEEDRVPAQVLGVGFLPARCNVLAALNIAEMVRQPAARTLLDEPPPFLDGLLGGLKRWTGLTAGDLDYIVLGAEIQGTLPQLLVLVQTRRPYLPGKLVRNLEPAQPTKHRGRLLVRFPLAPVGEGLLWCHSERIIALVLCLDAAKTDDLDALPPEPREGLAGFPAPLEAVIRERLDKQSVLWLAGHLHQPGIVSDVLGLIGMKTKNLAPLLAADTFAVGVAAGEELTLTGHFHGTDAAAAKKLEVWLRAAAWEKATSYRVEGPPPGVSDDAAQWVTLQIRGAPRRCGQDWRRLGVENGELWQ